MLATMAAPEAAQKTARHYSQCITRSQLTAEQLASFLGEDGRARQSCKAAPFNAPWPITLTRYAGAPSIECHAPSYEPKVGDR
jgi:hypothetical protein